MIKPNATDGLSSPSHSQQHSDLIDGKNIYDATEKTTPVDADVLAMCDSAASNILKKLSFLNLKLAIGSYLNPVGTIREFNVATNPNTLLGFGTWAAFGTGRVTVAIDAGQTEFDTLEETGGAKTHTLSAAESGLPAHNHTAFSGTESDDHGHSGTTGDQNQSHNHAYRTGDGTTSSGYAADTNSSDRWQYTENASADQGHVHGFTTGGRSTPHTHAITVNNNPAANASSAHNNLQPYIVVYRWVRTA